MQQAGRHDSESWENATKTIVEKDYLFNNYVELFEGLIKSLGVLLLVKLYDLKLFALFVRIAKLSYYYRGGIYQSFFIIKF